MEEQEKYYSKEQAPRPSSVGGGGAPDRRERRGKRWGCKVSAPDEPAAAPGVWRAVVTLAVPDPAPASGRDLVNC